MNEIAKPVIRQPVYQTIAEGVRNDILSGKLKPGDLLPSTEDLAVTWKSSYFTIHTALKTLVKEGWLERIHGRGTYVAESEKRFLHAAIYHSLDIWSDEEAAFQRRLNNCVVEKFGEIGKTTQIFVDSRPDELQGEMFPPLADAIYRRQIQCIIAPNVNEKSLAVLEELPLPTAFLTAKQRHPGAIFEHDAFMQGAVKSLAAQGCRSVGLIKNTPPNESDIRKFMREAELSGMETRPEWMFHPMEFQWHLGEFGFDMFRRLWKLAERPEGLIVYPDMVARGVILAALQAGVRVPEELKFVFHRNAHVSMLCPFPVTWGINDEYAAAAGLIESIQNQFAGRGPTSVRVPFTFEYDDARRWRD